MVAARAEMLGANVTIPWKEAVIPLLDDLDESARRIAGAVNTIIREETAQGVRLTGHNTDAPCFRPALDELAPGRRRRMLILGAGGAAQAALGVAFMRGVEPWLAAGVGLCARGDGKTGDASAGSRTLARPRHRAG